MMTKNSSTLMRKPTNNFISKPYKLQDMKKNLPSMDFTISMVKVNEREWLMRSKCMVQSCSLIQLRKMFEIFMEEDEPDEKQSKLLLSEAIAKHIIRNWNEEDYQVIIEALKIKLEESNLILPISIN